jgi:hypothetical protein
MKVVTDVPENYRPMLKRSQLLISIPDAGIDSLNAVISILGEVSFQLRALLLKQKFLHCRD